MSWVQAALAECMRAIGSMCKILLDGLKADGKAAAQLAFNAEGPYELSPQASHTSLPCAFSTIIT